MTTTSLTTLVQFRAAVSRALGRRRDALFELMDSLLTAGPVASPVHLSLEPPHRGAAGSAPFGHRRANLRGG